MRYQSIKDSDVSSELDSKLRALLSHCFTNGNDAEIFRNRRYYNEQPQHRYMLWNDVDLVAHAAVHDKEVLVGGGNPMPICGVAEVCVHPDYRKRGLVRTLLHQVHSDRMSRGDAFSVLFGHTKVYESSGYKCVNNMKIKTTENKWDPISHVMVLSLNNEWPSHEVKLRGIPF